MTKNFQFQKRNVKANVLLATAPIVVCVLLVLIQTAIERELNGDKGGCGAAASGEYENNPSVVELSDVHRMLSCPIPRPPQWPAILQVPHPASRAAGADPASYGDLPEESCRRTGTCPAAVLLTGENRTFATDVAEHLFGVLLDVQTSDLLAAVSDLVLGTDSPTSRLNLLEPAFSSERPLYILQPDCAASGLSIAMLQTAFQMASAPRSPLQDIEVECVDGTYFWRNSSVHVNNELFDGYIRASNSGRINEIMAAYDFLNSSKRNFNVRIWYNSTYKQAYFNGYSTQVRVVRSVNLVSNAYLKNLKGADAGMLLEFTKEMPKPATKMKLDFSSIVGPIYFQCIIELLFPVLLTYLVYEKQHKLRIMMKMHGLRDGPYWIVSYFYFLTISTIYVFFLVVFGSLIGLQFFTMNDYSLQFVFYFVFINFQIALAFVSATVFSDVKTGQAIAYIYILGTAFLASYLYTTFLEDVTFSRSLVHLMEIFPAFAIYRGFYEFGQYSFGGKSMGTSGMQWANLHDKENGMERALMIIFMEWLMLLPLYYLIDKLSSVNGREHGNPSSFLRRLHWRLSTRGARVSGDTCKPDVYVDIEKCDVKRERQDVQQLLNDNNLNQKAILAHNLGKIYSGRDGNPSKFAVQGISLALSSGECFGLLGPNGAGKTTFISMMVGLTTPSFGDAYVKGHHINADMDKIYTSMGVCPQHDMLWDTMTGREHLLFYGRLKNLKGEALTKKVEESLKNVKLFQAGVADKQVGKYSGGMKRRLSVAISLIGDPKVVYMDEPSTGLDPASRNDLWNVVKNAKKNRAIILTTHSMEEAEVLCDRLGVFVNGNLQCIGNAKELKSRYGGTYIFTVTTSPIDEDKVELLVNKLSTRAKRIYHIPGTLKFEIPKQDVKIAEVFMKVEEAKRKFQIRAWGLSDTTLEDVFIKVAKEAS